MTDIEHGPPANALSAAQLRFLARTRHDGSTLMERR